MRGSAFAPIDGHRPAPRFLQRRLPGEQRGRMSVVSDAEQRDVKERPVGSEPVGTVEALERRLVGERRLAAATSPPSGSHGYCRRERGLAKGTHREPYDNCCRDDRAGRTVHHPRTNGHGPTETATRWPALQAAHRAAAASTRQTGKPRNRASLACAREQSHWATFCASASALSNIRLSAEAVPVIAREPSFADAPFRRLAIAAA